MNLRTALTLALVILLCGCAHITEANGDRRPKTDMGAAISIARSYIKSHHIDVSEQFLSSAVSFHDVYKPEKTGWRLTWVPANPTTLDGEWSISVYDDGRVIADE
jgi:hypothetical protein